MAQVGVLEAQQVPSDQPSRFVKRSVADLLVRRLLAKRISRGLIHMVVIREAVAILAERPQVVHAPVPKIKPPRGPEGLILQYPLKDYRTCEL